MSNKKKIQQNDKYRFLATDVLPYETPLRFSLASIHRALNDKTIGPAAKKIILGGNSTAPYEPYKYNIYVKPDKHRKLSLFHPHTFEAIKDIYSSHDLDVINSCRKSDWSLRAPYAIAKTYRPQTLFYNNEKVLKCKNEDPEKHGVVQAGFSSYFSYKSYTQINKFYESKEYVQLESKFKQLLRFDVSSCFGNIYTHTIEWAIRTREQAKKETRRSEKNYLGSKFDNLMMRSNSNETHGILVGSELSRIFAEIIFQQIDLDSSKLCEEKGYSQERHFSVRRYVDDYFLFYNDENIAQNVKHNIELCLEKYKLHLNDSKEVRYTRPFETNISVFKGAVNTLFDSHINSLSSGKGECSLLLEIRRMMSFSKVTYSECGVWIMNKLYFTIQKIALTFAVDHSEYINQRIVEVIEAAFFIIKVEPKYRVSISLMKILARVNYYGNSHKVMGGELTINSVGREFRDLISSYRDKDEMPLEIVCLFAGLSESVHFHPIPIGIIEGVFLHEKSLKKYSYFELTALLAPLQANSDYSDHLEILKGYILQRIQMVKDEDLVRDTENFLLAIEIISNPLFPNNTRKTLAGKIHKLIEGTNATADEKDQIIQELADLKPFNDWAEGFSMHKQIAKKELSFTY